MDGAVFCVVGVMAAVCLLIVIGAGQLETLYHRRHPPDFGDGCREDDDDE